MIAGPFPLRPAVPVLPGLPTTLNPLTGAAASLAKGAVKSVLDGVVSYLASGAESVVQAMVSLVGRTSPDLTSTWFLRHLGVMVSLVSVLVLPMLAAASIGAVLRQDMARLGRTWGVFLPLALVSGSLIVPLTAEGLKVTDAMSSALTYHMGTDLPKAVGNIGKLVLASMAAGAGPIVSALLALVVVAGSLMVWVELLLRSAAIYVAVFFLPLALAGLVWPATSHWAKRCVHLLVALLLAKFVIVGALTVGVGALSASGQGAVDQALMGGAILVMAAFTPFLLLRLAPMVEAAAIAHLEGASRRPINAARSAMATSATAVNHPLVAALAAGRSSSGTPPAESAVAPRDLGTVGNEVDAEYARATGDASPRDGGGGDGR